MIDYIETTTNLLQQPFMVRAVYAAVVISITTAAIGVFVTLKKESFIADAIAHGSLAGIAFGLVVATQPLVWALVIAVAMALSISYLKKTGTIAADSIIGILFPALFALAIVMLSLGSGYRPELTTFLFGNLLAIDFSDLIIGVVVLLIVMGGIIANYRGLLYSTFDPEAAKVSGVKVDRLDYIYAVMVAVTIVVAVKLAGIILVTSLMVVPAVSAKLLAKNFQQMLPIAIIHNLLAVVLGIFLATYLPIGPTIVLTSTALIALVLLIRQIIR